MCTELLAYYSMQHKQALVCPCGGSTSVYIILGPIGYFHFIVLITNKERKENKNQNNQYGRK